MCTLHSCTHWQPRNPSNPPHLDSYTRALLADPKYPPIFQLTVSFLRLHTIQPLNLSFLRPPPPPIPQLSCDYHPLTATKIPFMYSQKRIAGPQFQFPHLWACERYTYSQDQSTYFPAAEYADRFWEYVNRSQTHECGNWDWGSAIPFLGLFVSNFRYYVFAVASSTAPQRIFPPKAFYTSTSPRRLCIILVHPTPDHCCAENAIAISQYWYWFRYPLPPPPGIRNTAATPQEYSCSSSSRIQLLLLKNTAAPAQEVHGTGTEVIFSCYDSVPTEAEFLDKIQTKVSKVLVFLLVIHSHPPTALLEIYISTNSRNLLHFL